MNGAELIRSAVFSADRKRRYELIRDWSDGKIPRFVNFIMLNPSAAAEQTDDPTIRKCIGFADRWGYNGIAVTNLTAEIATDPWDLSMWSGIDYANSAYLQKWITAGALLVAAWGGQPRAVERNIALPELIHHVRWLSSPAVLHCIGETTRGAPLHPSRTAYTSGPVVWRLPE